MTSQNEEIKIRKKLLKKILVLIREKQEDICKAAFLDMGRSEVETHLSEIVVIKEELKLFISKLEYWAHPKTVPTPFQLFPASSRILYEPYGKVLVIAPWNFPFHLSLVPAIGALAAGNTVVIKPSPHAPNCAALLSRLINEALKSDRISVVSPEQESVQEIIPQAQFVFFTGSPAHGREINRLAAEYMIPVVMELGGQNPLIYHKDADDSLIRRIAWGKLLNAGQTCLSPNHAFIHVSKRENFLKKFREAAALLYGEDAIKSSKYASIINDAQFNRITGIIRNEEQNILYGGKFASQNRRIEPTVIEVSLMHASSSELLNNELFGPVLPVVFYDSPEQIQPFLKQSPLVTYLFSKNKKLLKTLAQQTNSGAICVNDCLVHGANPNFPFGGMHKSGIGKYHGKFSFQTFSNAKSVLIRQKIDLMPRFFKSAARILFLLKRM